MGPVARQMLQKAVESPNGEAGYRGVEIASSAIKNGWMKLVYESGRIKWYAITETGRAAWAEYCLRHRVP